MSPVQRSGGHAGRALAVAVVGVLVALGVALGVAVLVNQGRVDVRLGDDTAFAGQVDQTAEAIDENGPVVQPDLAGRDRDIVIQHLGDDPGEGWLALAARPAGTSRDCFIQWQDGEEVFQLLDEGEVTGSCDGRTFPADGGDLPRYPIEIEDERLYVDLRQD